MKKLANFFSYLGHPIFMPLLACMIIGYYAKEAGIISYSYPLSSIYLFLAVNTIMLPLISVVIMKRYGMISDLNIDDRKERVLPYMLFTAYLMMTLFLLKRLNFDAVFGPPFVGVIVAMLILLVLNYWTKVSAHSIGISGVIGTYLGIGAVYQEFSYKIFILLITLAVAITTSRIILGKHTPLQIFLGMIIGVLSCYLSFKYVPFYLLP